MAVVVIDQLAGGTGNDLLVGGLGDDKSMSITLGDGADVMTTPVVVMDGIFFQRWYRGGPDSHSAGREMSY